VALADKLYVTGDWCMFVHIFSFIRLEILHFSVMSTSSEANIDPKVSVKGPSSRKLTIRYLIMITNIRNFNKLTRKQTEN
jgi:hypothetical protein